MFYPFRPSSLSWSLSIARGIALPLTAAIALTASNASAQGWTDFTQQIGDGYEIIKFNAHDISLCRSEGGCVLSPSDYEGVGPIDAYSVTPTHVFTRNLGRRARNRFHGDTFEEIDPSRQFYFIVIKADDSVRGPFTETEFSAEPVVRAASPLDWYQPWDSSVLVCLAIPVALLAISVALAWALSWLLWERHNRPSADELNAMNSN